MRYKCVIEVRQTARFAAWLAGLRDRAGRARILKRIDRMKAGNPGDVAPVGGGVSEMRVFFGPGYRLYFVDRGGTIIILLCGGDKATQASDIAEAKAMARELTDGEA